jgi:hypothetical protein
LGVDLSRPPMIVGLNPACFGRVGAGLAANHAEIGEMDSRFWKIKDDST